MFSPIWLIRRDLHAKAGVIITEKRQNETQWGWMCAGICVGARVVFSVLCVSCSCLALDLHVSLCKVSFVTRIPFDISLLRFNDAILVLELGSRWNSRLDALIMSQDQSGPPLVHPGMTDIVYLLDTALLLGCMAI